MDVHVCVLSIGVYSISSSIEESLSYGETLSSF